MHTILGCPCRHQPDGYPVGCDHGWTRPGPHATTLGLTSPAGQITTGCRPGPDGAARCPTCAAHAKSRALVRNPKTHNTAARLPRCEEGGPLAYARLLDGGEAAAVRRLAAAAREEGGARR